MSHSSSAHVHREEVLEDHFCERLAASFGYRARTNADYDVSSALDRGLLTEFVRRTQAPEWSRLEAQYPGAAEEAFVEGVERARKTSGTIGLFRQGVKFLPGIKFDVVAFAPASGVNPDLVRLYQANILSYIRQVRYSARSGNEIDVVLFINGIPVATIEIKNKPTGTSLRDAENQYRRDRPPANEPLLEFKRGAIVHFALDDDNASMTTRLENGKTRFVPFDRGRDGGAGNPEIVGDFRVGYLWADQPGMPAVFSREVLLQILGSFVHYDAGEQPNGRRAKPSIIFPRYHQLSAVRKIMGDAKTNGAGQNYLIQHSAGSGKSNTIAWTAHRLIALHNDADQAIFDTVVIVTDRIVLDRQLQGTISQFEQTPRLVNKIDGTSRQLKAAIEAGARIIVTTIQKFGTEHLKELTAQSHRNFAVLVDEAHASQSGAAATALGAALGGSTGGASIEEMVADHQRSRGPQSNVSYVAFTATPRNVTIERFGRQGPHGMEAFHVYPMRQAIEEGFILDVLQSYMTYKAYYALEKVVDDDPELNVRRARPKVARFAAMHPTAIDQKVWVIVEHFRRHVMTEMEGKAKAMVVTGSREAALRYHRSMRAHIEQEGYDNLVALVAFSGELDVDGQQFTEAGVNGFSETELPDKFDENDAFKVLIVAEKYQTGFDQPKLCAMYVDRKLAGLQAVQTLSRLNRTAPDKRRTFILDFQNEVEEIKEAFRPFYHATTLEERSDPNLVYQLEAQIRGFGLVDRDDIEHFARVYFKGNLTAQDRVALQALLRPAIDRFGAETEERQEEFRQLAKSYSRFYAFVAQIVRLSDTDLEKLDAYIGYLLRLLPDREIPGDVEITDEMLRLRAFRLEKVGEENASLEPEDGAPIGPITEFGAKPPAEDEGEALSEIVQAFNDRHGTDFQPEDLQKFEEDGDTVADDDDMSDMLRNNPRDVVFPEFSRKVFNQLVRRLHREHKLSNIIMTDPIVRERLTKHLFDRAIKRVSGLPEARP